MKIRNQIKMKKKTEPANANRIDITNKINKVFEWNI